MLHGKPETSGFHVLQVGVQFQGAVFVKLDDQRKRLIVLGIPLFGLIGGDAGKGNIDETLLPQTATLVHLDGQRQLDAGEAALLGMVIGHDDALAAGFLLQL